MFSHFRLIIVFSYTLFKQLLATENGPCDNKRGNPIRDALERSKWFDNLNTAKIFLLPPSMYFTLIYICILSLLAKLDKADRAFCFTSGKAALSVVAQLLRPGNSFGIILINYHH